MQESSGVLYVFTIVTPGLLCCSDGADTEFLSEYTHDSSLSNQSQKVPGLQVQGMWWALQVL